MSGFAAQPARDALTALAAARDLTVTDLARSLGVDRSTVYRLYTRSTLRYDAADHIAIALGRHPSELWPDWFRPDTTPLRRGDTRPASRPARPAAQGRDTSPFYATGDAA